MKLELQVAHRKTEDAIQGPGSFGEVSSLSYSNATTWNTRMDYQNESSKQSIWRRLQDMRAGGLALDVHSQELEKRIKHQEEAQRQWEDRIANLQAYIDDHGDAKVPKLYKTPDGYRLGEFIVNIRRAYRNYQCVIKGMDRNHPKTGTLTPEQVSQLDSMGFVWNGRAKKFGKAKKGDAPTMEVGRDENLAAKNRALEDTTEK